MIKLPFSPHSIINIKKHYFKIKSRIRSEEACVELSGALKEAHRFIYRCQERLTEGHSSRHMKEQKSSQRDFISIFKCIGRRYWGCLVSLELSVKWSGNGAYTAVSRGKVLDAWQSDCFGLVCFCFFYRWKRFIE